MAEVLGCKLATGSDSAIGLAGDPASRYRSPLFSNDRHGARGWGSSNLMNVFDERRAVRGRYFPNIERKEAR